MQTIKKKLFLLKETFISNNNTAEVVKVKKSYLNIY